MGLGMKGWKKRRQRKKTVPDDFETLSRFIINAILFDLLLRAFLFPAVLQKQSTPPKRRSLLPRNLFAIQMS